jgi:hypothetical protein
MPNNLNRNARTMIADGLTLLQANRRTVIRRFGRARYTGTYEQYTADPRWHRIAAEAKRIWRALGIYCVMNANHRGPVEVHHRRYDGVPFGEDWQDLIPLCESCHALYHAKLPKPGRGLFDVDDDGALPRAA